jgi:DNA-binding response OmpR family regulator/anti-sigma regulatory factor (Ser/Thr protein kinase)
MVPAQVLVIEDNLDQLEVMRLRLEANNYRVTVAQSGAQGIAQARLHPPDLILLDIMMPSMDGLEALRILRTDASLPFIPIALLTAKSGLNEMVAGLDAGADDYLIKPVSSLELLARVRSLIRLKRLHDQIRYQAVEEERRSLLADLHDGIGSSLTSMLAMLGQQPTDLNALRRRMGDTLTQLRLLVDTHDPRDLKLIDGLATCRHRFSPALESAGITSTWTIDAAAALPSLSPRDVLQIELIIAEAISNVLHHSHASEVWISFRSDGSTGSLTVRDNGRGFTSDSAGRGLQNMMRRAEDLAVGGSLQIVSAPAVGTTVSLIVNLNLV